MISQVLPVAVIGAGLIGVSWAALFSAVGDHEVRVWDPSEAVRAD
ncbi:3-hydroxyacyl-CoA dehydrogenase NAD-binding domain-containing protein, partial [Klebsiella pneumoniae]